MSKRLLQSATLLPLLLYVPACGGDDEASPREVDAETSAPPDAEADHEVTDDTDTASEDTDAASDDADTASDDATSEVAEDVASQERCVAACSVVRDFQTDCQIQTGIPKSGRRDAAPEASSRRWLALPSGRLVIRFEPGRVRDVAAAERRLEALGLKLIRALSFGEGGYLAAPLAPRADSRALARRAAAEPDVRYAHPDWLRPYERRSDPLFERQWHLSDAPLPPALPSVDVGVTDAWRLTRGSADVVIAIADDGVDLEHEDLAANLLPGVGYDLPADLDSALEGGCCEHGTSVAGVAGAVGDNDLGGSGVCPSCSLMPLFMGDLFIIPDSLLSEAFAYAVDQGADVINCSWGPLEGSTILVDNPVYDPLWEPLSDVVLEAFDHAEDDGRSGLGTLIVFAAGNGNAREEPNPFAGHPNTVTVAATDDQSRKSFYSSFGTDVDIAASSSGGLTSGIVTTDARGAFGWNDGAAEGELPDAGYTQRFGGTSSAAPLVSGVIGLMIAANPSLSAGEIRRILEETADPIDPVAGAYDEVGVSLFYGHGRVNAYRAVRAAMSAEGCQPFEAELCNGVDDTCDGLVDEGCPRGAPCDPCTFGAACESGVCGRTPGDPSERCLEPCDAEGNCPEAFACASGYCLPESGRCDPCLEAETCNGLDDDCDGVTDQGDVCAPVEVGKTCQFDAECGVQGVCLDSACRALCERDEDCSDDSLICAEATFRYGDSDGTAICGVGPSSYDVDCEALCGPSSPFPPVLLQPLIDCIEAATGCGDIFACIVPYLAFL